MPHPRDLLIALAMAMAFPGLLIVLYAVYLLARNDAAARQVGSAGAALLVAGIIALALLNP